MRRLYDSKAVFSHVLKQLTPVVQDPTLDDELITSMERDAIEFLDKVLHSVAGSTVWCKAIEIAYTPNTLVGYKRVAEYYRRAEAIQAL
jgi:hypothetical protein